MKDKKKLLLIGGIILVFILGIILCLVFFNTKENKNDLSNNKDTEDKIDAPANSTEELVKKMEVMEVQTVTEDEIVFSDDIDLKENQKVAVWIYSEPKFLGYFEVLVENGVKKIVGLKEAIEKITIEDGNHNIAITSDSGKPLGYVDVRIENNGTLTESVMEDKKDEKTDKRDEKTTTKKITETETIKYSSTKQNEANMKRGATAVVQAGSNGTKEITYEVTYDSNGKELSRKKISEKTTKNAVDEIVKVGTSDFNINTDTTHGNMSGVACPESKTYTDSGDGLLHCNDQEHKDLGDFSAIIMSNKIIVTNVGGLKLSTAIIATPVNNYVYVGTYNGQKYYFDNRAGDGAPGTLTLNFCNEYGLSCGAW